MSEPTHHTVTITGYRVEARDTNFSGVNGVVTTNGILTKEWSDVPVNMADHDDLSGFPLVYNAGDLMPYETARAIAYMFIAKFRKHSGVECQLVAYRHLCRVEEERKGVVIGSQISLLPLPPGHVPDPEEPKDVPL